MGYTASRVRRTTAAAAAILCASWFAGSDVLRPAAAPRSPGQASTVVQVSNEADLQTAVAALTSGTTIVLTPGTYKLTSTLNIKGALTNVSITGSTNNPNDVVLVGMGMTNADYGDVPHGISVGATVQGITISNLTIRDVFKHAISLEPGSEAPRLYNLRLVDAGQQFVKAYPDGQGGGVDDGVVEGSVVEYTVEAPGTDTGGVHVAGGARWIVRGNRFRNIKSSSGLAAPVVLMAQGARDSVVERNIFVNSQQEIALGAQDRTPNDHAGGVVRNNFIARDFTTNGGAAIQLVDSPVVQVLHNTILSNTASASLIEYRFADTTGVVIRHNLLDGNITARDGATATASDNYTGAVSTMFTAPSNGDLHLLATAVEVIDQATSIADAATDFDGDARPQGSAADYGADEAPSILTQVSTSQPTTSTSSTTATQTSTSSTESSSTSGSTLGPKGLPGPWDWTDVGSPRTAGSVTWSSNTFTVNAAGADIAENADEFTFVYQMLDGDGEIVAHVGDLHRTHPWAKAGLMFRDELQGDAKYAGAFVTADKGLYFQFRMAAGATTTQTWGASGKAPQWLKLSREDQTFTAFTSPDGANWTKIGSDVIYLNKLVYVGLAVTSHSWRTLTTASFNSVAVTATAPDTNETPQVAITSPTSGTSYNTPCTIEVTAAASDPDGTVTRVDFYSGSTLIGTVDRPPFTVEWKNVPPGIHKLKARVQDDDGATATSPEVEIDVAENQAPAVSLTAPSPGATYTAPASIALAASASDADGSITQVDFFSGSTLIGSDTTSPYTATWADVPAGGYTITAVARDNTGATTTSAPVSVSVNAPANVLPAVTLTAPAEGSTFTAGLPITMEASASDADGAITKVDFYAGAMLVGSDTSSPYAFTWSGATAGTYTLSAKASDSSGASTISIGVNVTVEPASTLPSPWQTADVGSPSVAGSADYGNGSFTVAGAGTDIWGTSDQFRFVYQTLEGDGAVDACVKSLDMVDSWTKAGVMIRDSLAPDSPYAYSMLSAGWGVTFQYRAAAGQSAAGTEMAVGVAPHCLRLVRKGSSFTAYQSLDGSTWAPMGSTTIAMGSSVLVGLAVTSRNAATAAEAVFDRVELGDAPANQAPTVALTSPTSGATFTAPATVTLNADASDSDGSIAGVDFYAGTTLVGSDASSPYSITWSGAPAGTHSLTAVARDDSGGSTTSAPISITVEAPNQAPMVSITAPSNGANFTAPANITVSASASDSDGSVAGVEFYGGTTLIGSDSSSPYSINWANVPAGSYNLKAVAKDNDGATTTSATVSVTVSTATAQPPVVAITSPTSNASFGAPANITVTATASAADGTVAPAGLIAHWKLDEGSGSIVSDSVGQNSGTLSNGPAWSSGQMGGAVQFDGKSQYIALPGMDVTGSALTLSAWVYNTAFPQGVDQRIISKSTDTAEQSHYWMLSHTNNQTGDGSTKLRFRLRAGGNTTTLVAATGNLPLNTWYHAAATYDGASMRLYLNGVEVGSVAKSGTMNTSASVPVNIARSPDGSNYLSGALDDVRIYNAALTPLDIIAVMNSGSVASVDFYAGSTLIGSSKNRPYSVTWSSVAAGSYTLTAVARDHNGGSATSAPVSITVAQSTNQPPSVSLTSPSSGSTFTAPANITLGASASDSDGSIASVDFYSGGTLIGSDTSSPYAFTWASVPAGTYTLTAVARDNNGATTSSGAVSVTVSTSTSTTLPKYVAFNASADHDTNVTSYTVEFFSGGADPATATPVRVQNVGKPAPVNGEISVNVETTVEGLPAGTYFSTVSANGSGGSNRSAPSETFVR